MEEEKKMPRIFYGWWIMLALIRQPQKRAAVESTI